jgi:hypothetical protein
LVARGLGLPIQLALAKLTLDALVRHLDVDLRRSEHRSITA